VVSLENHYLAGGATFIMEEKAFCKQYLGLQVVALFTAIYRSQRDRRPVSLPPAAET
jgi:uncharacterized membrane protein